MAVMSQAEEAKPFTRTYLTPDEARSLANAGSLDAIVLWDEFWMWTKDRGVPDTVYAGQLSANTFQVLGVPPLFGRTFDGDLSSLTADSHVAVLSHRYWRDRYGSAADAIGRTCSWTTGRTGSSASCPSGS